MDDHQFINITKEMTVSKAQFKNDIIKEIEDNLLEVKDDCDFGIALECLMENGHIAVSLSKKEVNSRHPTQISVDRKFVQNEFNIEKPTCTPNCETFFSSTKKTVVDENLFDVIKDDLTGLCDDTIYDSIQIAIIFNKKRKFSDEPDDVIVERRTTKKRKLVKSTEPTFAEKFSKDFEEKFGKCDPSMTFENLINKRRGQISDQQSTSQQSSGFTFTTNPVNQPQYSGGFTFATNPANQSQPLNAFSFSAPNKPNPIDLSKSIVNPFSEPLNQSNPTDQPQLGRFSFVSSQSNTYDQPRTNTFTFGPSPSIVNRNQPHIFDALSQSISSDQPQPTRFSFDAPNPTDQPDFFDQVNLANVKKTQYDLKAFQERLLHNQPRPYVPPTQEEVLEYQQQCEKHFRSLQKTPLESQVNQSNSTEQTP